MRTGDTRWRVAGAASLLAIAAVMSACGSSGSDSASTDNGASERVDETLRALLPDTVESRGSLVIAGAFDTPPVISADMSDATKATGIAPDLAAAVGELLGVSIEYKNVQWTGQLPGLEAGTFDAVWGQINTTPEREKTLYDMTSYVHSYQGLLIPGENPKDIKGNADLCGLTVGTAAGSLNTFVVQSLSNDICIAQGKPAIKNQEYPNAGPAVTALRAGQLDAYNDTALANAGIAASSNGVFELVTLDPAELEKYDSALLGIATLKSNPDMAAAISGALQKLEADGTYMKILDEYGAGNSGLTNAELAVNALTGTPAGQRIE